MSDPARLTASNGLAGALLASAKTDRAPDGAARRLLAGGVVAGALAAKATSAGTSMASLLGHAARWATWKWVALAVVGTGSVVTAKAVLAPAAPYAEAPRLAVRPPAAPVPRSTPAPRVAVTPVATPASAAPVTPPEPPRIVARAVAPVVPVVAVAPVAVAPVAPVAVAPVAPVAVAPVAPIPAASAAPPQPSHLALEIASVDGAKRALAAGDAAAALQKTEAYDVAYPNGMLAAEAHALHIEALVRLGRREEARTLLARFEAEHPGSPLLEALRHVVH